MVVKAVVGANYGDEGKGLMTDYFCHQALLENKTCLNVLTNGGAQRGHTVVQGDKRHVFHHFGSGTFSNATTYISKQFIVNPMIFMQELNELNQLQCKPKIIISKHCRISTPYDMMFNQIMLEQTGKHNSCGLGIWATVSRFNCAESNYIKYLGELHHLTDIEIAHHLQYVRYYYNAKFCYEHISINDEWKSIFYNDGIIDHYIKDFRTMIEHATINSNEFELYNGYDYAVFENAQGLLISDSHDKKYGTPSETGSSAIYSEIKSSKIRSLIDNLEICYVSRKYLTRHGDGPFPEECDKSELGNDIEDNTNVYNECQGHLRYGRLNADELHARIERDIKSSKLNPQKVSLALTHTDQHVKISGNFMSFFLTFNYISSHPDSNFVIDLDHPERVSSEKLNTFCNRI